MSAAYRGVPEPVGSPTLGSRAVHFRHAAVLIPHAAVLVRHTTGRSRRSVASLVALLAAVTLAGCASDGKDLADAQDWQTTTTRPAPPTSAPDQQAGSSGMAVTSPLFDPGDDAPLSAQCAGDNVYPTLEVADVPDDAIELAVTLADQTDPDEPLLLWLMAGIPATVTRFEGGFLPVESAFETLNDYGNPGWGNPCIENLGNGRRDLQFTVYALGHSPNLAQGDPGNTSWDEVAASAIDSATLLMRIDGTNP